MTTNNLKPRAIAALVALRSGPRTIASIRDAISDTNSNATRDLMNDLRGDHGYVALASGGIWCLTHEGIGWCESNGMPVAAAALTAASRAWEAERAATGGAL